MYLVERYWPGVTIDALHDAVVRLRAACETVTAGPTKVRHVESTLLAADETVFCLFEATSLEAVVAVNRRAEVGVDRVGPCLSFRQGAPAESSEAAETSRVARSRRRAV